MCIYVLVVVVVVTIVVWITFCNIVNVHMFCLYTSCDANLWFENGCTIVELLTRVIM